jgi:hypothetical protein
MNTHAETTPETKNRAIAGVVSEKQNGGEPDYGIEDNRPEAIVQRKLQEGINNSPQVRRLRPYQEMSDNATLQLVRQFGPKGKQPSNNGPEGEEANGHEREGGKGGYAQFVDEKEEEIKKKCQELGAELVGTYRYLDQATKAIQQKKNNEAIKAALRGVAQGGVNIATILTGIPGMISTGGLNLTAASAAQQGASSSANFGINSTAPKKAPSLEKSIQGTSTIGAIEGMIKEKVGSLKKAGEFLLGIIPFAATIKEFTHAGKLLTQSDDEFNKNKADIVKAVVDLLTQMDVSLSEKDFKVIGPSKVTTANAKNFFNHTTRTLEEVHNKYLEKAEKLKDAIITWEKENPLSVPLLSNLDSED